MAAVKNKRGRHGKYEQWLDEDNLLRIEGWARDGLNDEQIAKSMGIGASTFYEWKAKFTDIAEAIKKGRAPLVLELENVLVKRARGFSYEETKVEILPDGSKKGTQYTRYAPPDTTALIFFLKKRRPEIYGDHAAGLSGSDGVQDFLKAVKPSEEDLQRLYEEQEADTNEE